MPKRAAATKKKTRPSKSKAAKSLAEPEGSKLTFNHAMVYARDVERSAAFYSGILGMKVIEDFRYEGKSVYSRLRAPGGDGTIAIHQAGPGAPVASEGVRLYFEIRELDGFCDKLREKPKACPRRSARGDSVVFGCGASAPLAGRSQQQAVRERGARATTGQGVFATRKPHPARRS